MFSRIDEIKKIIEQNQSDPFPLYGLAMEYKNLGQYNEACEIFDEIEVRFPKYIPKFLMHGQTLIAMKHFTEAKIVLQRGILLAKQMNNQHALRELDQALDAIDSESETMS